MNTISGEGDPRLLRCLVFCVLPTLIRINPAGRFPYTLCLQTLELYSNLIEAICHGSEFRGQVDSHNRAGGNALAAFDALNWTINSIAKLQYFSDYKSSPSREIAKEQ
jgi:hypothetical protein